MAEFLTTRGTSHHIENIIMDSKNKLILVSPFLQLSKTLFERLKDASKKGVQIKIIYGKDELKPNEKNSLAELTNVELFFHENLHAKCYFNETKMVITSMNMYQFSENNNREMGILIDAKVESELFNKAVAEAYSIIEHSEVIPLNKANREYYTPKPSQTTNNKNSETSKPPKMGYCLRCENRLSYDPSRPYCIHCFSSWVVYQNPTYNESVCHCCGEFTNPISMGKPQCYTCNKKFPLKQFEPF